MYFDICRQAPAPIPRPVLSFRLTYSPAHFPNGAPIDPHASRQILAERCTTTVQAPSADAATWVFERETNRMVTACTRLQDLAEGDEE